MMSERCDGRYPVPQTTPPREEPFDVTYRCGLHQGHQGPHGPAASALDALSDEERQRVTQFRHRLEAASDVLVRLRRTRPYLVALLDRASPGASADVEQFLNEDLKILEILDKYLPAPPLPKEKKR